IAGDGVRIDVGVRLAQLVLGVVELAPGAVLVPGLRRAGAQVTVLAVGLHRFAVAAFAIGQIVLGHVGVEETVVGDGGGAVLVLGAALGVTGRDTTDDGAVGHLVAAKVLHETILVGAVVDGIAAGLVPGGEVVRVAGTGGVVDAVFGVGGAGVGGAVVVAEAV